MEKRFFHTISPAEFLKKALSLPPISREEHIPSFEARDRVVARDVLSPEDFPPFPRSAMDGYAICARDSFGASNENPAYLKLVGEIRIDAEDPSSISPGECIKVYTGSPLPRGCDAVIMLEYTEEISPSEVEIRKACAPWENIIVEGEDARRGEVILRRGERIRAQDIGILCEVGVNEIVVFDRPRVGVVSTGDELVPPHIEELPRGKIRDVNTYVLSSMIESVGGRPIGYGIIKDREEELKECISQAIEECDMVLISGGSSVGTADLTEKVLLSFEGARILCHGVSISPGKPTMLATIEGIPVVGLPGQVTSAQVVMYVLVYPLIRHLGGEDSPLALRYSPCIRARLDSNIPSKPGREDYVRVRLSCRGEEFVAQPIFAKSGLLRSLLQADGLVRVPSNSEGILKHTEVDVLLL